MRHLSNVFATVSHNVLFMLLIRPDKSLQAVSGKIPGHPTWVCDISLSLLLQFCHMTLHRDDSKRVSHCNFSFDS